MQPILMVSAPSPGLCFIGGRLVGEIGEDPICVPVAPRGAVFMEYKPYARGIPPACGRLTLADGQVLPESLTDCFSALLWPGGVAELECSAAPDAPHAVMPDDPGASAAPDGTIRLLEPLLDTVGHVILHTWRDAQSPDQCEMVWAEGAPHWPDTPEATALAAAEAVSLGLLDEARGYCTPAALLRDCLRCLQDFSAFTPLRFGPPQAAIGGVRVVAERCARVIPIRYTAIPARGTQGRFLLDDIAID